MRAHALLSASGAYRWTVCTKAPHFEEQFTDSSSSYAAEGTLAHALAEHCLLHGVATDEVDGDYPEDMRRYVQEYVDYVMAIPGERYIEQRVDFSHIVPEGFGTSDAIIIQGDTAHCVDLKYGKGKKVYADGPQGKLYVLGALHDYGFIFDHVKYVVIHIHQPRLDWVDQHRMSVGDLEDFGAWIKERAEIAFSNKGEFVAGEHCDFCRGRKVCKARADANLKMAQEEFGEPCPSVERLTLQDIASLLPRLDPFIKWANDIQEHALEVALSGDKVPGYKVVAGRTIRKWTDEVAVADAMRAEGLSNEQVYSMKLIGMTEAEKLLGKKSPVFDLAVRTQGKPALVPESDKRPELSASSAAADFGD